MDSLTASHNPVISLVGAGLVGSLLAVFLARRGYHVEVLERRGDPRKEVASEGRSINLAISARGLEALRHVGLDGHVLAHAVAMRGRAIHAVSGDVAFQAYGKDDSQCIHSISRGWLNRELMSAAERTGNVHIDFYQRLTEADLDRGRLTLRDERTGAVRDVPTSVTIGTDGSASSLRAAMVTSHGAVCEQSTLEHGYKEITMPAGPGGAYRMEKHALHIWPRGQHMLIALPNEDGSFTCTLFLAFRGQESFEALTSPALVRAFFAREYPDALAHLSTLEEQFFAHPTGSMVTVKTAPWFVADRALLVGDAAHAIVPFYGQGMNCGFEDCVALDAALTRHANRGDAFAAFYADRKSNADAIAAMAVDNFIEMRDKTADPRFLLQKQIEKALLNAFPGEFSSRYTLVSFGLEPYAFAMRVGNVADAIVAELAEGIQHVEQLDLGRAAALIRERLRPVLRGERAAAHAAVS